MGGVTPVQGTASYSYDGAGRISYLTLPGQSGQTVSWDHDGNRLTYQGVTYAYNMDDSIATAGGTSFTYFPTGARRTDGSHFYCYDGYDRLLRATVPTDVGCNSPTISYAYEGLDRQRAHNEGSGSTYLEYDGLSTTISAEFPYNSPSGAGTVYALAGSRRTAVGSYASGGVQSSTINYLADDGMGNISTAVTTGGSMACTAWSDAWGVPMSPLSSSNPCNTGSTLDTNFYTGTRRDQITGDYQFGVRTYDPKTGSFLEPDTFLGSRPGSQGSVISDPLTMNRYVYVNGDPLNLIDPSGHMVIANDSAGSVPVYIDTNQPGGGAASPSTSSACQGSICIDPGPTTLVSPSVGSSSESGAGGTSSAVDDWPISPQQLSDCANAVPAAAEIAAQGRALTKHEEEVVKSTLAQYSACGGGAGAIVTGQLEKAHESRNDLMAWLSLLTIGAVVGGGNWPVQKTGGPGCYECAVQIQKKIGGKLVHITPDTAKQPSAVSLGDSPNDPNGEWGEHWVVEKDGRYYDSFTGPDGMTAEEYQAQWTNWEAFMLESNGGGGK